MASDSDKGSNTEVRANVFVSYSRNDSDFVDRLEAALVERGFAPKIDRTEIYAFEDWWKRIEELIVKADTIVFVLSPDAVASEVCKKEVAFAASLKKRFAPVVCRAVDPALAPEELARLNFIYFDDEARTEESADKLAEALSTNIDWVRRHTELGDLARRWALAGRPGPKGLLLRPPTLEEAESWIGARPHGAPEPTETLQTFITESRRAETQRRKTLTLSLGLGLAIAVILSGLAFWQRSVAVENARIAEAQRVAAEDARNQASRREHEARSNQSSALGALSAIALADSNPTRAIKLALAAWPQRADDSPPRDNLMGTLASAVGRLRPQLVFRIPEGAKISRAHIMSNGARLATRSDDDKSVRLWNAESGAQIAILREGDETVGALAESETGARIATLPEGDGKPARLWDASTGARIANLGVEGATISSVNFSADGSRIVGVTSQGAARIWSAATGEPIARLSREGGFSEAELSPDGKFLAAVVDGAVELWAVDAGKKIATLPKLMSPTVTFQAGMLVTATYDGHVRLWNPRTGKLVKELFQGSWEEMVTGVEFAKGGKRLFSGARRDNDVYLWNAETGKQIAKLRHPDEVYHVQFSSDGQRLLVRIRDNRMFLWDGGTGRTIATLRHALDPEDASFSDDGKQIVSAAGKVVTLWDAATGTMVSELRFEGSVNRVSFAPGGQRLVVVSSDGAARLVDVAPIVAHKRQFSESDWENLTPEEVGSKSNRLLSISSSGKEASVQDLTTGKTILRLVSGHELGAAIFSPDETKILTTFNQGDDDGAGARASEQGGAVELWDANTGAKLRILPHDEKIIDARFSADGFRILSISPKDKAQVFEVDTGRLVATARYAAGVDHVSISRDGKHVLAANGKELRLWDVDANTFWAFIEEVPVVDVLFLPDGGRFVVATKNGVQIWDVASRSERALFAEGVDVKAIDFTTDGDRLLITAADKAFQWDLTSGAKINEFEGQYGWSQDGSVPAYSPDGRRVALARKIFDADSGDLIADLSTNGADEPNFTDTRSFFVRDGQGVLASGRVRTSNRQEIVVDAWSIERLPKGNLFEIACASLDDHSLRSIAEELALGVTEPICRSDPRRRAAGAVGPTPAASGGMRVMQAVAPVAAKDDASKPKPKPKPQLQLQLQLQSCLTPEELEPHIIGCGGNEAAAIAAQACLAIVARDGKSAMNMLTEAKASHDRQALDRAIAAADSRIAALERHVDEVASYSHVMVDNPGSHRRETSLECFNTAFDKIQKAINAMDHKITELKQARNGVLRAAKQRWK